MRDVSRYQDQYQEHDSLDAFLKSSDIVSGLHGIKHHDDVFTDALYWNQNSDVTVVCFNGAGAPAGGARPGFNGTSMFNSWKNANRANFLFLHDATIYAHDNLSLAWYSGSRDFDYQEQLEPIIRKFVGLNRPRHLIFFGVSGGGYAALKFSASFPGSITVAGNPQTNIDQYVDWAKNKYYKNCWPDPNDPQSIDTSGLRRDLVPIYRAGTRNFAYCLVNVDDAHHVDDHLIPLIEASHRHLNVRTLLRHWGTGHTASPPQFFLEFLDELVRRRRSGEIFPDVQGSRLLESRSDVSAVVQAQDHPLSVSLFAGQVRTISPLMFELPVPVKGALELTVRVSSDSADPMRVPVEFRRRGFSVDRYIYGITVTDGGFSAHINWRPGTPSKLRVYIPLDLAVDAVTFRPPEQSPVTIEEVHLVAHSFETPADDL